MKMTHFDNDKSGMLHFEWGKGGEMLIDYGLCLSDYCDIFECREYSDKILKT